VFELISKKRKRENEMKKFGKPDPLALCEKEKLPD
jgi:hypothetical protein